MPARLGVSPARNSVRWRYFLCQAHIEPQLPRRRPLQKKDHILPDTKDHLFDSIGLICFRPLSCPWRSIPIERGNPPGENGPANQRAYSVPKHLIWNAPNPAQSVVAAQQFSGGLLAGFWNSGDEAGLLDYLSPFVTPSQRTSFYRLPPSACSSALDPN